MESQSWHYTSWVHLRILKRNFECSVSLNVVYMPYKGTKMYKYNLEFVGINYNADVYPEKSYFIVIKWDCGIYSVIRLWTNINLQI